MPPFPINLNEVSDYWEELILGYSSSLKIAAEAIQHTQHKYKITIISQENTLSEKKGD